MPHLRIQEPDQAPRLIELTDEPISIGRDDGPESVFIAEKKASRQHVSLRHADGVFVLRDLESSNGTWVGEQRIQRKRLNEGDQFRIGDTVFTIEAGPAPTSTPLVTGTLNIVRVDGRLRRPRIAEPEPESVAPAYEERPMRRAPAPRRDPRKALVKAAVLLGIGAVALAAVEFGLRPSVDVERKRAAAHREALDVLDAAKEGAGEFRQRIDEFDDDYPGAPELGRLNEHFDSLQQREDAITRARGRLQVIAGRVSDMPVSELNFALLSLQATLPEDEKLQSQFKSLRIGLERRREQRNADKVAALRERVTQALDGQALARAALVIDAFETANPFAGSTARDTLADLKAKVDTATKNIVADVSKRAAAAKFRLARAEILAEGVRRLQGWPAGTEFAEQLKRWIRTTPQSAASKGPGTTPMGTPAAPAIDPALLTAADKAEAHWKARRWAQAQVGFAELVKNAPKDGPYLREWTTRESESQQMLALVDALKSRLADRGPVRRKLSLGSVTVVDAGPKGAVWRKRKNDEPERAPWGGMPDVDALVLLTPSKPTPDQRIAIGVLAGTIGNRAAFIDAVRGIYENPRAASLVDTANRVVARHLYGRDDVPEGGYRAHGTEILDTPGYQAALRREEMASLRATMKKNLATLAKANAFKKLAKLADLRKQLDEQRKYALLAIFNEKHYPYPYGNASSEPYRTVASEVARRVGIVRETWSSPLKVRITPTGRLSKSLDALTTTLAVMRRLKMPDVEKWASKAERFLLYTTDEPLTIQTYFHDAKERDNFKYDEWIRSTYNPARLEYAKQEEREQIRITNDYRRMMAYAASVKPSDASYEAINSESVKAILDAGKILGVQTTRAVRLDNHLVKAARDHSIDMAKRGYFSHHSKPDPGSGVGSTAPHDRMQTAGYVGWAYSENIAINTSAQNAHNAWASSSGHHRNLLSPWHDLGVGHQGKRWTQNFGSGGGARPKIYPNTDIQRSDMMDGRTGR